MSLYQTPGQALDTKLTFCSLSKQATEYTSTNKQYFMANAKAITSQDFEGLKNTSGTYLFDFWATWCGPCKVMNPIIESLSQDPDLSEINFVSIDVDEQPELAGEFRVQSIPTFMVIKFKGDGTFDKETDIIAKEIGVKSAFDFKLFLVEALKKSNS